jgi:hypothetical protein
MASWSRKNLPEEAPAGFMKVDPEKAEQAEKREKKMRKRRAKS